MKKHAMLKNIGSVALLMVAILAPETICNTLHVGEERKEYKYTTEAAEAQKTALDEKIECVLIEREEQNLENQSPLTDEEWAALCEVCEENRIDTSLALGLIWVESRFNPRAVSSAGCYGYCQINPKWHPADLSPVENIKYGIRYLKSCIDRYDDLEAGLTAYNAGHDTGHRWYANAVLDAAEMGLWKNE